MSNGHVHVTEPESILKGKLHATEDGNTVPNQTVGARGFPVSLQSTLLAPPTSLATTVGTNNSSSSTTSATSNLKRATRKLSLSAPMLGFGKRDKDKEQHEKGRTSPNFISAFLERRI
jgi:ubiquitin carboxyl-terminal hydrolase 9/13